MKIIICGLGYVGSTMAACLLRDRHSVVGIDVNRDKVEAFLGGASPISEPGVDEMLASGLGDGRLAADTCIADHAADSHMIVVSVGTPSHRNGALDLSQVLAVTAEIGDALKRRPEREGQIIVNYRSTMLPGSMDKTVIPALAKAAGSPPGDRYDVVYNPEFLREGTAVQDYFSPPKIVIGERVPGCGRRLRVMYGNIEAPVFKTPIAVAEMAKYADNSFHALKVAFANELGRLARVLEIPPQAVADIFVSDRKLNISPYYLRPGGAFGGSCLPKDVRALTACFRDNGVSAPVVESILNSNGAHKDFLAQGAIAQVPTGGRVLLLGLTFKTDTDDLRESPLVDLAENLLGKGYQLTIYDPDLRTDELTGTNLCFAKSHLPHLSSLMTDDVEAAASNADLIIVGKSMPGLLDRLSNASLLMNIDRL